MNDALLVQGQISAPGKSASFLEVNLGAGKCHEDIRVHVLKQVNESKTEAMSFIYFKKL